MAKKRTSAAEAALQMHDCRHGWSRALKQNELFQHPLKPHCKQSISGTAEAVPLNNTDFFSTLFSPDLWQAHTPEANCKSKNSSNSKSGWG